MLKTIKHQTTNTTLYEGQFTTMKDAVEQAVKENVALDFADFSNINLNMANLDGGSFRFARFHNTQMQNANLSEASFEGAQFNHCILDNSFFCESILNHAGFINNSMVGCDIAAAHLKNTIFSGHSSLDLNFRDSDTLDQCIYYDQNKKSCTFSHAPIAVYGLAKRLICFGDVIDINGILHDVRLTTDNKINLDLKGFATTINRLLTTHL